MASKLLQITVFILNVIAFGLAVAAEQRRSSYVFFGDILCLDAEKMQENANVVQNTELNYNYCVYESDIATGYGVGAFLFFLVGQVIIMVASRCFCCGKPLKPGGSRAWAVILFIVCWVFFLIAEACLLAGSVRNAYHTKYRTIFGQSPPDCQQLRKGVFGAGAAFIFLSTIVSEFYYVCYSRARESFQPYGGEAAVGLGTFK